MMPKYTYLKALPLVLLFMALVHCTPAKTTTLAANSSCAQFATNCWKCVEVKQCAWCLARGTCTLKSECLYTPYTDCCVVNSRCSSCLSIPTCGYCIDDQYMGCEAGNKSGPTSNGGFPCAHWVYGSATKCPGTGGGSVGSSFMTGVVLVIGATFVILSGTLLILFVRYMMKKQKARENLEKHYYLYKDKEHQPMTCFLCADHIPSVYCSDCSMQLCPRCSFLVHQDDTKASHRVTELNATNSGTTHTYTTLAPLIQRMNKESTYGSTEVNHD